MSLTLFNESWQEVWSGASAHEDVGAVYTKPKIVDLILDLSGYVAEKKGLASKRLLEPGCGDGAFIRQILERLIASEVHHSSRVRWDDPQFDRALRAVDISQRSLSSARRELLEVLRTAGCPQSRADELADSWLVHSDFLLHDWGTDKFDFVIGNPPYVRIEDLPRRVLAHYRGLFASMSDRADLYVVFFERGLELLSKDGTLGFISANRFAKNAYGEKLRKLLGKYYRVKYYLNLEHTQPFVSEVSAYPAITIVDRRIGSPTRAGELRDLRPRTLKAVRRAALSRRSILNEFPTWYAEGGPWISTNRAKHSLITALASRFPTIEASGDTTKVGIGVATGADRVYVLKKKSTEIEPSRQIPLLMAKDITPDKLAWSGHYLVNPFADSDDGNLVRLTHYPKLARYFEAHSGQLRSRHVAAERPKSWFRTIDRVWVSLQHCPKLVIPDIQTGGTVGYDEGLFYPHHNVYFITSSSWPLRALQAVLRSSVALAQVKGFSVQMRGGSLRYQAQTLRQIRIPRLADLSSKLIGELEEVGNSVNQIELDEIVGKAYDLVGVEKGS